MNEAEYKRELESWAGTLAQAMRDVVALLVFAERRPRLADDMASSLETLVKRIRRAYPEER